METDEIFSDVDILKEFNKHYGLNEIPNYKIIPLGYRCCSSHIIKVLNLKKESYPFDWTISKLSTIKDCILNDFKEFLKIENYVKKDMNTYNIIDSKKELLRSNQEALINTYYNNINEITNDFNIYDLKLALIHHDIFKTEDYEYYKRCINRFKNLLKSDDKKLYLYINQIIGINEYNETKDNIIMEFINFNEFMKTISNNINGIFFILVKTDTEYANLQIINSNPFIYVVMTNKNFLDTGEIFYGSPFKEIELIIKAIKSHL
jgi:hypothetical protein